MEQPRVLLLGHSFIRRLRDFIVKNSPTYNLNLNINTSVTIHWHGVGGRTIDKVRRFDLTEVERFKPDVVFLQIGTNDLLSNFEFAVDCYAQKTSFEAKGRLYTTATIIQRLFIIVVYT